MRVRARGMMALAVTPYVSSTCAADIVMATIPAFGRGVVRLPGEPKMNASEDVLMMRRRRARRSPSRAFASTRWRSAWCRSGP
jgi:hypothetical protein